MSRGVINLPMASIEVGLFPSGVHEGRVVMTATMHRPKEAPTATSGTFPNAKEALAELRSWADRELSK